ncbi:NUDIX hydrolase domain-like protein [Globomyces pollinis-pini]|nr:NUDIX hydrolase domain-like protein [Globomyces pollinis-pini]
MFIRRAFSPRDRWSGHIAFPGGKQDKGETDRETVERETLEEIGLDLKSKDFQYLGRLNDRDVKAPASRRTLMVLCCFIYIQLNHNTPTMTLNEDEIQSIYWVPITNLVDSKVWEPIYFNISNHLFPKQVNALIGGFLEAAVGGFSFFGIPIDESYCEISTGKQVNLTAKKYPLWGLTLWMTSDLLTLMGYSPIAHKGSPRYSSWDVDGMISLLSLGKPRQLCTWLDRSNIRYSKLILTAVVD